MGIQRYLDSLKNLRQSVTEQEWLEIGWDFLETMGVGELHGCDLDILPILERIPHGSDFIDVQSYMQHTLVETLLDQLETGGTTILLNIDKMEGTPATILIPLITELRVKELVDLTLPVLGTELIIYDLEMNEIGSEIIPDQGDSILLEPLWLTAHGQEILSERKFGLRTNNKGLDVIRKVMRKTGMKLNLQRVDTDLDYSSSKMSEAMQALILAKVLSREIE